MVASFEKAAVVRKILPLLARGVGFAAPMVPDFLRLCLCSELAVVVEAVTFLLNQMAIPCDVLPLFDCYHCED